MSRYTRAHHDDAAAILRKVSEGYGDEGAGDGGAHEAIYTLRAEFADLFQRDNPEFNRARFRAACEPKEGA